LTKKANVIGRLYMI